MTAALEELVAYDLFTSWALREELEHGAKKLLGVTFLGVGCSRAAFLYEGLVYKVPLEERYVRDNLRELHLWKSVRGKLRNHLVKAHRMEGNVLVMDYAGATALTLPPEERPTLEFREWINAELAKRIPNSDPDIHLNNLSVDWKVIDYAGID